MTLEFLTAYGVKLAAGNEETKMTTFRFGKFEVDVERRTLCRDAEAVKIGARAFDILACLVGSAGKVVTKDELIRTVWPATHVDDVALRVHMVALRKAISDGGKGSCIESIAGRGYQFVSDVSRIERRISDAPDSKKFKSTLPAVLEQVIGREAFIKEATELLGTARLMTIVGPGGIGKTTVALNLARDLEKSYDRSVFLDLAALSDGSQIGPLLASRLCLVVYTNDPLPGIVRALAEIRTLLIFDNCEHLIDDCAEIVERLLGAVRTVTIIATSRETLRVRSEHVRILQGLTSPEVDEAVNDPHSYSAVELFVRRFEAANGNLSLDGNDDLLHAAAIVTRLDGIPLAIELAAARAASLGIRAVYDSMHDPINLLKRGKRTAPQRQQTLRATLEWSFSLLSPNERRLLEYLSVFAGSFHPAFAAAIVGDWICGSEFEDAIGGLSAKSLISVSRQDKRLRLLEVTRAFAREELARSGNEFLAQTAHANWVLERLGAAARDWTSVSTPQWMSSYSQLINDVRLALQWSFDSGQHDRALKLAATSHVLWTQLGLMGEHLRVLQRAVGIIEGAISLEPSAETRLRSSYAAALFHIKSLAADEEAIRQFRKATLTAEATGDQVEIVRAHSGITEVLTTHGRYKEAMDVAARLEDKFGLIGNNAVSRMGSINLHFLGQFEQSDVMCRRALEAGSGNVRSTQTSGAGYDQRLMAMLVLARNAWIRGDTGTSLSHSREVVAEALNLGDPISTCLVLAVSSCAVYLGMGEFAAARHHLDILKEVASRHSLSRWTEWADGYELLFPDSGATELDFERSFAESTPGPRVEGAVAIGGTRVGTRALDLALSGEPGWCRPELLRVKGELVKHRDANQAKRLFEAAYQMAAEQGSRVWQLRAATSLLDVSSPQDRASAIATVDGTIRSFPGRLAPAEERLLSRASTVHSGFVPSKTPIAPAQPDLPRKAKLVSV